MGFVWPFDRHSRWQNQLDAYVDGELRADELDALEEHLRGCDRCGPEVVARRELKQMAATLPELPMPRSFRITPGMLVEAPRERPSRAAPVAMRLAQVTAGLATIAFAGVVAAHVSQGDESPTEQQAATEGAASPLNSSDGDDDSPLSPTGTPTVGAQSLDSAEVPGFGIGASPAAGAGALETGEPPEDALGNNRDSQYQPTTTAPEEAQSDRSSSEESPPAEPKVTSSVGPEDGDEDGGLSGFVAAEIGLAALAGVATVTWLVTRPRGS